MIVNFVDNSPEAQERKKVIEAILPTTSLIEEYLYPAIEKKVFKTLKKILLEEIEIYRQYPKRMKEEPKEATKTFDPRNNNTCFVGKAFKANDSLTDMELEEYREKVGTIDHPMWGDCTLLEIWGGDHFEKHPKMVSDVFKYGMGIRKTLPNVKIHVNPLFANKNTGDRKLSKDQKEHKEYMEDLLAKAMVFGVRNAKEAQKARTRR